MKQHQHSDENTNPVHTAKGAKDTHTVYDRTGYPIPKRALAAWEQRFSIEDLVDCLDRIEGYVLGEKLKKTNLFHEVNTKMLLADLSNARTGLKRAVPYATCFMCQGQLAEGCKLCGGRGMVSKHTWDLLCPIELKALRKKVAKK